MRILFATLLSLTLLYPTLAPAESNVNVNINVGVPLPPPLPRIHFDAPPLFLAPSSLGFYVGVDMPHDLLLVSGSYYLFQGNHWYRARHYNGPWTLTPHEHLPYEVRRHKVDQIRYQRDHEYRSYHEHRDHYRGKHYRPGKEEKEHWKEEKRREKEERKHHKKKHKHDDD